MKNEVAAAVNTATYVNISTAAKGALMGPATQAAVLQAKADIHALVVAKTIKVQDNMHLLLGSVNPTPNPQKDGSAVPTSYHTFDTLQIQAIHL